MGYIRVFVVVFELLCKPVWTREFSVHAVIGGDWLKQWSLLGQMFMV